MSIQWKYVKPLEDETAVKGFITKKGVILPKDLIDCLERNNGGRPSEKDFKTASGREYVFKSLYSYNTDDKDTIYGIIDVLSSKESLYPIGSDAARNIVCYNITSGKYELYIHETDSTEDILNLPFLT